MGSARKSATGRRGQANLFPDSTVSVFLVENSEHDRILIQRSLKTSPANFVLTEFDTGAGALKHLGTSGRKAMSFCAITNCRA